MSELPTGWIESKIGDVAESMKNGIYKKKDAYADDGIACLRMYNIEDGAIVWKDIKRMRLSEAELETYGLLPGDLLVNRVNSRELVGKTAVIPSGLEQCVYESKNIRLRVQRDVVEPKWVSYKLLLSGSRHFDQNAQQVVGMASISQPQIAAFPIPLPPLPEQRHIVARIEELFSRLDAGVAALRHAKAQLQRYRQSVLAAAVTGQLTQAWREQHPDTEPASELLERILEQRRAGWTKKTKFKEPASVDHSTLPGLPAGWIWCTTDQLGQPTEQPVLTGPFGSNLGRNDFIPDGDVNVLTIGCLQQSGIDLSKALRITSEKADDLDRYKLRTGDLLFSRMASVGRAGFVTPDLEGSIFNYHIMRLRLSDAMLPSLFVSYVQSSPVVSKYVRDVNHGATRDGINTQQLLSLPVPLAPVAEQHQIVAEVEARTTAIDHLGAELDRQITRSNRLRQSSLAAAFNGQLT